MVKVAAGLASAARQGFSSRTAMAPSVLTVSPVALPAACRDPRALDQFRGVDAAGMNEVIDELGAFVVDGEIDGVDDLEAGEGEGGGNILGCAGGVERQPAPGHPLVKVPHVVAFGGVLRALENSPSEGRSSSNCALMGAAGYGKDSATERKDFHPVALVADLPQPSRRRARARRIQVSSPSSRRLTTSAGLLEPDLVVLMDMARTIEASSVRFSGVEAMKGGTAAKWG